MNYLLWVILISSWEIEGVRINSQREEVVEYLGEPEEVRVELLRFDEWAEGIFNVYGQVYIYTSRGIRIILYKDRVYAIILEFPFMGTINNIKIGSDSKFLKASLGTPDSQRKLITGSEIYRYDVDPNYSVVFTLRENKVDRILIISNQEIEEPEVAKTSRFLFKGCLYISIIVGVISLLTLLSP
jgi:hypothetical protein